MWLASTLPCNPGLYGHAMAAAVATGSGSGSGSGNGNSSGVAPRLNGRDRSGRGPPSMSGDAPAGVVGPELDMTIMRLYDAGAPLAMSQAAAGRQEARQQRMVSFLNAADEEAVMRCIDARCVPRREGWRACVSAAVAAVPVP